MPETTYTPENSATCAEEHQLVPTTLQDLSFLIAFINAYKMTQYHNLKQMTHSLAYDIALQTNHDLGTIFKQPSCNYGNINMQIMVDF